jgi:hypothetical protein
MVIYNNSFLEFENSANTSGVSYGGVLHVQLYSYALFHVISCVFNKTYALKFGGAIYLNCVPLPFDYSENLLFDFFFSLLSFVNCKCGTGNGTCIFLEGFNFESLVTPGGFSLDYNKSRSSDYYGLEHPSEDIKTLLPYLTVMDVFYVDELEGKDSPDCGFPGKPCFSLEYTYSLFSTIRTAVIATTSLSSEIDFSCESAAFTSHSTVGKIALKKNGYFINKIDIYDSSVLGNRKDGSIFINFTYIFFSLWDDSVDPSPNALFFFSVGTLLLDSCIFGSNGTKKVYKDTYLLDIKGGTFLLTNVTMVYINSHDSVIHHNNLGVSLELMLNISGCVFTNMTVMTRSVIYFVSFSDSNKEKEENQVVYSALSLLTIFDSYFQFINFNNSDDEIVLVNDSGGVFCSVDENSTVIIQNSSFINCFSSSMKPASDCITIWLLGGLLRILDVIFDNDDKIAVCPNQTHHAYLYIYATDFMNVIFPDNFRCDYSSSDPYDPLHSFYIGYDFLMKSELSLVPYLTPLTDILFVWNGGKDIERCGNSYFPCFSITQVIIVF